MKNVTVSILCITYNHKEYIEQALNSILSQKTKFNYELLVNDDHSTDGTVEILKNYEKKYPETLKVNYQKENQFSKGKRNMLMRYLLPQARGKYIAICEGDDYWIDDLKLQKQVTFLDRNSDYSLCFHPVKVITEGAKKSHTFPDIDKKDISIEKLLETNIIQTNSVMYRRQSYKNVTLDVMPGDWYLHLYHAQFGKIGFINQTMSVYRRHPGGIWWGSQDKKGSFWQAYGLGHVRLIEEALKMYGFNQKHKRIIISTASDFLSGIVNDTGAGSETLDIIVSEHKDIVKQDLIMVHKELSKLQHTNESLTKELLDTRKALDTEIHQAKNLKNELAWARREVQDIYDSKRWKIISSVARLKNLNKHDKNNKGTKG